MASKHKKKASMKRVYLVVAVPLYERNKEKLCGVYTRKKDAIVLHRNLWRKGIYWSVFIVEKVLPAEEIEKLKREIELG